MANRKMTFTLPEAVAAELLHRVASRDRSRYVTPALTAKLREREERLIQACQAANINPECGGYRGRVGNLERRNRGALE